MSSPAVSVVMPVYNAERYVGEAVDSILAQTFSDYEFLIFDDGSTDRSRAILESYAERDERIRVVVGHHRGYVPWLNEGLRLAKGEFIARMDADDVSLPTRFARQVEYLRQHSDCAAVGTDALLVDADGAPICELAHDVDHELIEADLLSGGHGVIAHPSSMMRRATLLDIGGYREEFEPIEDFDLWFRLVERGRLANIPEVLFRYRQHRANVTIAQADRQGACADVIITEARRRRGLPPLGHSVWNYTPPGVPESHRQWALLAIGSGFRETASKHARRALAKQPWSLQSWAVFARCCLPGGVVTILKRLGGGSLWRRALRGGGPRRC